MKKLTQEQRLLVLDHLGYAENIRRKLFPCSNYLGEELDSVARTSLVEAVLRYNKFKSNFKTYSYFWIMKSVSSYIKHNYSKNEVEIDENSSVGEIQETLSKSLLKRIVNQVTDNLTRKQYKVYRLMVGEESMTKAAIARKIGVSPQAVDQHEDRIHAKIKSHFEKKAKTLNLSVEDLV